MTQTDPRYAEFIGAVNEAIIQQVFPTLDKEFFGEIPIAVTVEHGNVTHVKVAGRIFRRQPLVEKNGKRVDTRR